MWLGNSLVSSALKKSSVTEKLLQEKKKGNLKYV